MFKRAYLSLKRQPVKTVILLLIFSLIGMLTAGALVVNEAIQMTEVNLHRLIPPVATIVPDQALINAYWTEMGEGPEMEVLEPHIFDAIGDLPYVSIFDYAVWSDRFFSTTLNIGVDMASYALLELSENAVLSSIDQYIIGDQLNRFTLRGVVNPHLADIEAGLLNLVEGRTFTEAEMMNGTPVVVVSRAFALANTLGVGDYFTLEMRVHDYRAMIGDFDLETIYLEHEPVVMEEISLEIIGIFEPTLVIEADTNMVHVWAHIDMNTRIYTPIDVAKIPQNNWLDHLRTYEPDRVAEEDGWAYQDILFVLGRAFDLEALYEEASALLPDFWRIDDLRREFGAATNAMITLQGVTQGILIGAVLVAVFVVSLVIILFLRDRHHEIGVYMALGEKRLKIIVQLLVEILLIASVAITLSLFVGYHFSRTLSMEMFRTELVNNPNVRPNQTIIRGGNDFNHMGFSTQMTGEEMFATFSITLNTQTIVLFYTYSIMLFIGGTTLPTIYLLKLKPKDMLISF